jgi:hypothetical protein
MRRRIATMSDRDVLAAIGGAGRRARHGAMPTCDRGAFVRPMQEGVAILHLAQDRDARSAVGRGGRGDRRTASPDLAA